MQISYEETLECASSLKRSSEKMKDILHNVDMIMATLNQEDTWKSAASARLTEKFDQFKALFDAFYDKNMEYATFIEHSVETYKAADAAISKQAENV